MDGKALSVAEIELIADLETRVLLAKLAGAMKGNGKGRRTVQSAGFAGGASCRGPAGKTEAGE